MAQLLLANCPRQVIGETWVFVYGSYPRAWIQRNLSIVATSCHVYSDEREKMNARAPVFIQPRILCHGPEVGVLTLRSLLGFLKYSSSPSQRTTVGGVCNFFSSVSPQQKFESTDRSVLQLNFTWHAKENTSSKLGWANPKDVKRREAQFWLLFLYVFSSFP